VTLFFAIMRFGIFISFIFIAVWDFGVLGCFDLSLLTSSFADDQWTTLHGDSLSEVTDQIDSNE
jgi:hypothetical protein